MLRQNSKKKSYSMDSPMTIYEMLRNQFHHQSQCTLSKEMEIW